MRDKTVVVVAHRLSTVENATSIIVIDKGVVVEQGKLEKAILCILSSFFGQIGNFHKTFKSMSDSCICFLLRAEAFLPYIYI